MDKKRKEISGLLYCTSLLESKTASMYERLAARTPLSLIRSLLMQMAHDSRKHADIFKGIFEEFKPEDKPTQDCERRLSQIWSVPDSFSKKIQNALSESDLLEIVQKLVPFETRMGEEYYVFVQAQTLTFMAKQIEQEYDVNIESVKGILESVINDEGKHQEMLKQIADILDTRNKKQERKDPLVRYQSPDSWMIPPSDAS